MRYLKPLPAFLLLFLLLFLLSGCAQDQGKPAVPAQTGSGLQVVTSISPLADLIKNVGGDKVQVTALVKPGNDPHDYEPTPEDVRLVSTARIFFANGAGEEPYLERLVKNAASPGLKLVTLSDGLEILDKGWNGDYAETGNPHLWLDVQNAEAYVRKIRDSLSEVSPQNRDYYAERAATYLQDLDQLDKSIAAEISSLPQADRQMVVFHAAWPYFAKRYGLELKSLVKNSDSEPSAREYADLITYITSHHVKAVFGEVGFNPKLVQQLARDTGVKFVGNLYDDTVSPDSEANTYIKMMTLDVQTIVKALK